MKFIATAALAAVVAGQDAEAGEWVACPSNLQVQYFSDAACENYVAEAAEWEQPVEDFLNYIVGTHEGTCAAVEGYDQIYGFAYCDASTLYGLTFNDDGCTDFNEDDTIVVPLYTCFQIDEEAWAYVWGDATTA